MKRKQEKDKRKKMKKINKKKLKKKISVVFGKTAKILGHPESMQENKGVCQKALKGLSGSRFDVHCAKDGLRLCCMSKLNILQNELVDGS